MKPKFKNKKELAKWIESLGGILWEVGGAIRDELMGINPHDHDFVITGIDVRQLPNWEMTGKDFPVFLVEIGDEKCEIALARTERKNGSGHKGFEIFTSPDVTIEEDLSRRDLTINSIAKEVLSGKLVDPFNGVGDLNKKILQHTTLAFSEDPLRVFRVARFAAKLSGFEVHPSTIELMKSLKNELKTLPIERIWEETLKALNTINPSRFFEILDEADCLDVFFPEVANLNVPDKHDGTAFNHTLKVLDYGLTPIERFGLLCHDLGKGLTNPVNHPSHFNHDRLGIEAVKSLCKRLRIPNKFREFGIACAKEHMKLSRGLELRPGKFFQLIQKYPNIEDLLNVSFIDAAYREGGDVEEEIIKFGKINKRVKLAIQISKKITGKNLIEKGIKPGKDFGAILLQWRIEELKNQEKED